MENQLREEKKLLLSRAEECRRSAEVARDAEGRALYIELAKRYEALAEMSETHLADEPTTKPSVK